MPAIFRTQSPLWLCFIAAFWLNAVNTLAAGKPERFVIFAAASMKDAMEDARKAWSESDRCDAVFSFAASSALARQIEYGAPADIFISANRAWMDHLEANGKIASHTRFDLAGNRLVLIERQSSEERLQSGFAWEKLPETIGEKRVAIALADSVPAGIYAKAALEHYGLWEALQANLVQTDNVRAALRLVDMGEAAFGIVYRTDAMVAGDVSLVAEFPESAHPPIGYPAAMLATSGSNCARMFLDFLHSQEMAETLHRYGFSSPERPS